jgi:D-alanine-D-alanine ligase
MKLNTYAAKWAPHDSEYESTPMRYDTLTEPHLRADVLAVARAAWLATGARHYLRVDVRLDAEGVPRVIDVNPNPSLSPGIGVGRAAIEYGWTWNELITRLVQWAC